MGGLRFHRWRIQIPLQSKRRGELVSPELLAGQVLSAGCTS